MIVDLLDCTAVGNDGRGESPGGDTHRFAADLSNEAVYDPVDQASVTVDRATLDRLDRPLTDSRPGRDELNAPQSRRT